MENVYLLLIAILLLLLNAFFVAAEFSMVKLRDTRVSAIKEKYGFRGKVLERIHCDLDVYLSACQLGITFASIGLGWIGEPAVARLFMPIFNLLGIHRSEFINIFSFFVAFSIISFLHIVVGELMPKSLAIRRSETLSIWTAVPLYGFYWIMYPGIRLLNNCSNFFLNKIGFAQAPHSESIYTPEEIKTILSASHLHGELTKKETEIMEKTMEFSDLATIEVMQSRANLVSVDINENISSVLQIITQYHYSRYPVYDAQKQKMIGIIHVKDIFDAIFRRVETTDIKPFVRPVLKISYDYPAIDLLHQFRVGMSHFALVYKNEALLGFVTLDNLLHLLIGGIKDEYHVTQDDWLKNPDGSLSIRGECTLYALEKALGSKIELSADEEEIETIGGLILARVGKLPYAGEKINFPEFDALIEEIIYARISKIKIYPKSF